MCTSHHDSRPRLIVLVTDEIELKGEILKSPWLNGFIVRIIYSLMSVPRSAKEETSTDNINQKESSSDKQQRLNFMRTPKLQGKLDLTQKRRNGKINTDSLNYSRKSSLTNS